MISAPFPLINTELSAVTVHSSSIKLVAVKKKNGNSIFLWHNGTNFNTQNTMKVHYKTQKYKKTTNTTTAAAANFVYVELKFR